MDTIVAIDLDGVLNPYAKHRPHGFDIVRAPYGHWWLSSVHGRWIQQLRQVADVYWASAWEYEANAACRYYGIAPLPVITFPTVPDRQSWKTPRVFSFASKKRLVWIDDEIHADAFADADNREYPTLLVPTHPQKGLVKQDFDRVLSFIKND